jgi:hypothetical protein
MVHLGPFKKYVARGLLVKTRWSRLSKGKLNKDAFMNQLKNIKVAGAMLIAGAISPLAMADTVTLYAYGQYSYGDGGEFTAYTSPTTPYVSQYSPYTSTSDSFQTFCIQTDVEFYNGGTYDYTLSLASIGEGLDAPGTPNGTPDQPDSYALAEGTAWLYAQFATGKLAGYDFSNALGQRQTDAGELQAAIWALQNGQSLGGFPSGTVGNTFYNDVVSALGAGNIETPATYATDFGTEVMNLTLPGQGNFQNQLIYTGVPDGGSTLVLLGAALSGLGLYRRRG